MEDEFLGGHPAAARILSDPDTRGVQGRITDLLLSGKLSSDLGHRALDPACDRVMVCGSQSFNSDMVAFLNERGFA